MSTLGVTPSDIRDAGFGLAIPEGPTVDAQIQKLIDKAEERLLAAVPSVPRRIAAGTLPAALVKGVVEDMVLRVIKNPRALRQMGVDDFQATIDTAVSSGALYVTGDERALLAPAPRGSVGSLRIGLPRWRQPGA
ncbi:hypothetical protein [Sanguibacter massiliensis]|uniref:hypothetical protein n=1 Tax=Sanguibacter massiliensis TaxID=1973217 RepID=UPI000C835725|nr:hypothetical protein [Sanguibacter massiliensis]